ncbi:MAG: CHAT domain-containing protein, partial [Ignavibacteriaceae bacterium]
ADIDYKIGLAYYELDSLAKAEKYFDEGIKTAKKSDDFINEAFNTEAIIQLYIKENKTAETNKFLDQLDKISVKHSWDLLLAEKFLLEGIINRKQNNFNNAKLNFEKALKKANNLSEFNLKLEAYHLLAKLFEEHHLNEAAESYYNSAIKVIEDVSRPLFQDSDIQISYFAGKRNVYDDYANFLLNKKKYKQAFELIEKTHSRNTIQNLNNLKIGSIVNNEETLNKIYQYDWIINSGIYNKEEVDSVKNLFSELKLSLTKKFPSLKKYLNLSQSLPLKEIQSHIDENQKLLSIYTTENSTYLFLISKDDFKQFEVKISQDKLKKKINAVSSYFGADSNLQKNYYNQDLFSFNAKAANELYKILIEPVIKFINEDDELIIIPSFITASIPFEFLVTKYDDEESPYNYADKKFLIYKYNISYSPSAAVFIEQKTNNFKNKGNVLIVGNPSIDNNSEEYAERRGLLEETGGLPRNVALLPLKYSGEEVQEISKILSSDKVLIEKDATETNFKKNAEFSKVIHLSTHSFLFNKQPLIFFSNAYDPDNDGLLEASEIVQLKLNSDLIVLSSCNSALGSIDESEGIIGMTKAFFEAGSKSVVASLWEVNDKYTSKFMVLFYKRLSEGFDKSKALRLAKIDFIKNYSANPYFWSAFILSGNVSKLDIKKNIEVSKYIVSLLLIIAASVIIFLFIRKKKPLISNL